ncbi:MAG: hypothetical protein OEV72_04990, partial [Thermoleophilia bacterium]|nr:hypothetical protein [Thermoleophilia bacterium]
PRYWMLETIREYASERLSDSDVAEHVAQRHSTHYADRFAELAQEMRETAPDAIDRADEEAANIRCGLGFAIATRHADIAASYLFGVWSWLVIRGALHEAHAYARAWTELDLGGVDPVTRFAGDVGVSEIFRHVGDRQTAIEIKRRMLADLPAVQGKTFHGRNVAALEPGLLTDLAHLELDTGEIDAAQLQAEQALVIREAEGHPFGVAHALNALVAIASARADFGEARRLQARVVGLTRGIQLIPVETVVEEVFLAELELLCGQAHAAEQLLLKLNVDEIIRLRDRPAAADTLRVFATWLALHGVPDDAARLLGAYERLVRESGISQAQHVVERTRALEANLRLLLGDERCYQLARDGAEIPVMDLVGELPARVAGLRAEQRADGVR